ncbi:hypothetical protein L195_g020099 [Trifolium pratense]|uniref:Uncharacterized protein n=1 Tax=Trifolium pratense TaxID=57577 RepID=A0A2K3N1I7_TRIPR|nr:hypothetical protein L195_g020099 [Trifolium pratense]
MRSTKDVKLHRLYEDGVKRRHSVYWKKGTRRVKDLHGAYRKEGKTERGEGKGFEV